MLGNEISLKEKLKLRNKFTKKIINKLSNTINLLAEYDKYIYSNLEIQKGGGTVEEINLVIKQINEELDKIDDDNKLLISKTKEIYKKYMENLATQQTEIENMMLLQTTDSAAKVKLQEENTLLNNHLQKVKNEFDSILGKLQSGVSLGDLKNLVDEEFDKLLKPNP
jgi:hypothetical protein